MHSPGTDINGSLRITSSITSRLAFAIIWMTCRSLPPPMRTPPPDMWCDCAALDAPESAVRVPANAEVDQLGRLDARGEEVFWAGLDE